MAKYSKARRFKKQHQVSVNDNTNLIRDNTNLIRDSAEYNKLYKRAVRLVGQTNKKIAKINNIYGVNSWATKKLKTRLTIPQLDVIRKGKVKISNNLSLTQLKGVINAINLFNNSKTSSIKGIKSVIKNQKNNIKDLLSDEEVDITNEEANTLYDLFKDNDFNDITKYIPASDVWALLQDAKEKGQSKEQFLATMSDYIDFGSDEDMKKSIKSIHNKYVK